MSSLWQHSHLTPLGVIETQVILIAFFILHCSFQTCYSKNYFPSLLAFFIWQYWGSNQDLMHAREALPTELYPEPLLFVF